MRLYSRLFLTSGCEVPECPAPDRACSIYLVNGNRNAVRACCTRHAEEADQHLRRLEEQEPERRAA